MQRAPSAPRADPFITFWYMAAASARGLLLRSPNVSLLSKQLYAARRNSADPALAALSLRTSPLSPRDEIWLVRGSNDVAA